PAYFSTRWAQEQEIPHFAVQHHRAHIAACLAENMVSPKEKIIGIAFDGTGFGEDDTSWGGEFFVGALESLERRFHFESLPLPGGDAATRHPCRIAVGFLEKWGLDPAGTLSERALGEQSLVIRAMVRKKFNAPLTSSVGRLFDAAASLLGVCQHVTYEGQAAMELEAIAIPSEFSYPWHLEGREIRVGELFFAMLEDRRKGVELGVISGRFHRTLAEIAFEICECVRKEEGIDRVALSGGVFQNALLLEETHSLLCRRGFNPLLHRLVPANDGGLALGQAYLAAIESSK
ncbi:MAG TPA: carbamoyltransferase HypF, partial [Chroococcales cyanobacterium]